MSQSWVERAQTAVVIGATSGIGQAIAERLAKAGVQTVIAGRRQENLDKISSGNEAKLKPFQWDVTDHANIPARTQELLKQFPDVNQVWIVAGLQRTTKFDAPDELDLDEIALEINTNLISPIHLLKAFLPHLAKQKDSAVAIVSSSLALMPNPRTPVYNATKAGLHQMILSMRMQWQQSKYSVQIIEIYPPAVKTELHDTKNQKDLDGSKYPGMELDDAIDDLWSQLEQGAFDIPIGEAKAQFEKIDGPRRQLIADAQK